MMLRSAVENMPWWPDDVDREMREVRDRNPKGTFGLMDEEARETTRTGGTLAAEAR